VARSRDYAKEYAARKRRYKGLPTKVARGHGSVPANIAWKAEKGTLTRAESRKYREGLRKYQAEYGPVKAGRKGRHMPHRHRIPETFATERQAQVYATDVLGIPLEYVVIEQGKDGRWTLTLLR
jgi:hypothetical protein